LFFAAPGNFNEAFTGLTNTHALILSMRGVPLIDTSGLQSLTTLYQNLKKSGTVLMLASVQPGVQAMLSRGGLDTMIGPENFFWSADQAIVEAEKRGCVYCAEI